MAPWIVGSLLFFEHLFTLWLTVAWFTMDATFGAFYGKANQFGPARSPKIRDTRTSAVARHSAWALKREEASDRTRSITAV